MVLALDAPLKRLPGAMTGPRDLGRIAADAHVPTAQEAPLDARQNRGWRRLIVTPILPFDDSRRLLGANLFFAGTGAVLDIGLALAVDPALVGAWRERVERAGTHLAWTSRETAVRRHAAGASLALRAPVDQLYLATEINEWALCASLIDGDAGRWEFLGSALAAAALDAAKNAANPAAAIPPVIDESAALERFAQLAALEGNPALCALLDAADSRHLSHLLDDEELTLGSGAGARSYPMGSLPSIAAVRWDGLRDVPTALVTGSNGKTTTVRLLAACARAHGWHAGFNCTDGVYIDHELLEAGDYSGPAGARWVLREPRVQAAMLETARGGILRRGIAVSRADAAVITNVSPDHFGEYGIDDLEGLARTKLTVAAVVAPHGLLVLNADDAALRAQADGLGRRFGRVPPLGWFAGDADCATLQDARARGAPTCGVRAGRLILSLRGIDHDLGPVAAMPLTAGGVAAYNTANLAGAALAAMTLRIPASTIAGVFARFGGSPRDNPGRLMRYEMAGAQVLVDYAHNPEGLRGLLTVARHLGRGAGRLGMLLGHAGNRKDADIQQVARVAAEFRPDLVVVKENESQLRGRAPGEIPRILRAELLRLGLPEAACPSGGSELDAARIALAWARPGDVLVLTLHSADARTAVLAMLEGRR